MVTAIQERLKKKEIIIGYKNGFTSHILNLFIKFYNLKEEEKYCYQHVVGKNTYYTYSEQCIEFILNEIVKDPKNIVESLKESLHKKR